MTNNKEKYKLFCKTERELPIFMQDWWLDTVCGENSWDVVLYEENEEIIGVFPYPIKKKYIFRTILRPDLTPWLGPWIAHSNNISEDKKISLENKIYQNLIEQLPLFDWFNIDCNPQLKNWLSFYWKGYRQTTKYTYYINLKESIDEYRSTLPKKTRQRVVQAYRDCTILRDDTIDDLFLMLSKTFKKQNLDVPVSKSFLNKLNDILKSNKRGLILKVTDKNNTVLSASLVVWDNNYLYLLLGGSDPEHKKLNSKYAIIWEAINLSFEKGLNFNFEGSMMERIESLYRQFNPKQIPYFNLEKINSKLLRFYFALRA